MLDFCWVVKVNVPPAAGAFAPGPEPVAPYVIVHVWAAVLFTPVTWIVLPATPTVPQVDVVAPGAEPVVDGIDQPAGTATSIWPFVIVVAAVYVNVSVLPVDDALAVTGATVSVPVPSEPTTICGDAPRSVSVPTATERSCAGKSAVPAATCAVTPELKPDRPYRMSHVPPPASVTPVTWIVEPTITTGLPVQLTVPPGSLVVAEGVVHPAGIVTVISPLLKPPDAAV